MKLKDIGLILAVPVAAVAGFAVAKGTESNSQPKPVPLTQAAAVRKCILLHGYEAKKTKIPTGVALTFKDKSKEDVYLVVGSSVAQATELKGIVETALWSYLSTQFQVSINDLKGEVLIKQNVVYWPKGYKGIAVIRSCL